MTRWRQANLLIVSVLLGFAAPRLMRAQQREDNPAPRFPSYLKQPRSVDDLLPQARAFVATKEGNQGIGMGTFSSGDTILIIPSVTAEPMPLEAVRRALVERGIKPVIITEAQMAGLTEQDADAVRKATVIPGADKGYLEARNYWIDDYPRVFAHPDVARQWLRKRRPDLYDDLWPKDQQMSPELEAKAAKLSMKGIGAAVRAYLDQHPEVKGVYWGMPGGGFYGRYMAPQQAKFKGFTTFANSWALMSQVLTFPSDVGRLIEKKTLDMITPDIDQVRVTDAEGTDVAWSVTPEMERRWKQGMYWPNHLLMYPDSATGQYSYTFESYPAPNKDWIPREPIAMANGVIAGTNGSGGFWPRMEIHLKDGYITAVKGGGIYGDVIRQFLDYPHINDLTYPYYKHPGYWHLWEVALGTNPKFFRDPSDFYGGGHAGIYCLTFERYRSGEIHWGFGNELPNEPGSFGLPATWLKFGADHDLPTGHDFHIHNYFITYRVHYRSTGEWANVIDRGHLTALDDPEVRALAAHYGDADRILTEDWVPGIPGVNAPGNYEDYSRDPWKYANAQMKKILAGTYTHDYPGKAERKSHQTGTR